MAYKSSSLNQYLTIILRISFKSGNDVMNLNSHHLWRIKWFKARTHTLENDGKATRSSEIVQSEYKLSAYNLITDWINTISSSNKEENPNGTKSFICPVQHQSVESTGGGNYHFSESLIPALLLSVRPFLNILLKTRTRCRTLYIRYYLTILKKNSPPIRAFFEIIYDFLRYAKMVLVKIEVCYVTSMF